ncbi:MAG TPA: YceI family protein [Puia sp.]|nr:YceI family protein [Puia sp.]
MKKILFGLVWLCSAVFTFAQTYTPVDEASTVKFNVKNFGFNVDGSFKGLKGSIDFDPAKYAQAKFEVSIDANTIFTDNGMRDNHLREDTYFDVKNHPRISFVSTKITGSDKKGTLFVFGILDIKGIKKEISFPFTATPVDGGLLFKGEFKINRRDFDIGGSSTISNNVNVVLNVVAKK